MSRPHVPVLVLGGFITALTALTWLFRMDQLPRWLGIAASVATYLVAGIVYLANRRRPAGREMRIPDASPSSALLGIGVALAVAGMALGRWLTWVGAIAIAIALIGLATELSGGRRGEGEHQQWTEPPRGWPPET